MVYHLVLDQSPPSAAQHLQQEVVDGLLAAVAATAGDLEPGPLVREQVGQFAEHAIVEQVAVGILQPLDLVLVLQQADPLIGRRKLRDLALHQDPQRLQLLLKVHAGLLVVLSRSANQLASRIDFVSVKEVSPASPPSRPMPDCLKPPNGRVTSKRKLLWAKVPVRTPRAMR